MIDFVLQVFRDYQAGQVEPIEGIDELASITATRIGFAMPGALLTEPLDTHLYISEQKDTCGAELALLSHSSRVLSVVQADTVSPHTWRFDACPLSSIDRVKGYVRREEETLTVYLEVYTVAGERFCRLRAEGLTEQDARFVALAHFQARLCAAWLAPGRDKKGFLWWR